MPITWFDGIEIEVLAGFSSASGAYGVWGLSLWDTGTWGPETVFTDISEWVAGIATDRQFSRELAEWQTGTATIVLRNEDGRFTPSNPDSPYIVGGLTGIRPWRPIVVNIGGEPVFTGYAMRWGEAYEQGSPGGGGAVSVVSCVDELASLARVDGLATVAQGGGEASGLRIHRILDAAGHTGLRAIDVGRVTMQPTTHSQGAVAEAKLVTDSEGGSLYVAHDGAVTFEDRYHLVEEGRSRSIQVTFGDGGWQSALRLTGGSASMPDTTGMSVGDFDVRLELALDDWTPGGLGLFIASQWPNTPTNNAWVFGVSATGFPTLTWTPDGTTGAGITRTSTEALTFVNGTHHHLRVALDVNNGAGGNDTRFYTSADGESWTQLGGVRNGAGTTSVFNSTFAVAVATVLPFTGYVRSFEYRNALGVTVADPDFARQLHQTTTGAPVTTFDDDAGNTWTLTGNAVLVEDQTADAELPYSEVTPSYDGDQLVNIVALSRAQTEAEREASVDPAVTSVVDETSRALYGDSRYTRNDLINEADGDLSGIAELYLAAHKDPEMRIDSITFKPRNLQFGTATRDRLIAAAVGLRIRDKVRVIRRPPGGGTIVRDCHIAGIQHGIDKRGDWVVTLKLWSATVYDTFSASFWDEAIWDDTAAEWFF